MNVWERITCLSCGTMNSVPGGWAANRCAVGCWKCRMPLAVSPAKAEESFVRTLAESEAPQP